MCDNAKFCQNRPSSCGDITITFAIFWNFRNLNFWTAFEVRMANMYHHEKIRENQQNSFGEIGIFRFSRWRPSAILGFQNIKFLVASQFGRANVRHCTKFHQNRSNGCRDIAFNVFQNGVRPPSWVLEIWIFEQPLRSGGPISVTVQISSVNS